MLQPSRTKHRFKHRGNMKGISTSGSTLAFGQYGLKAMEPAWISARQIEAARRVMTRYARRGGRIWIRIFPDKPITARAAETRMGKGKGYLEGWVAVVKPGGLCLKLEGFLKMKSKKL